MKGGERREGTPKKKKNRGTSEGGHYYWVIRPPGGALYTHGPRLKEAACTHLVYRVPSSPEGIRPSCLHSVQGRRMCTQTTLCCLRWCPWGICSQPAREKERRSFAAGRQCRRGMCELHGPLVCFAHSSANYQLAKIYAGWATLAVMTWYWERAAVGAIADKGERTAPLRPSQPTRTDNGDKVPQHNLLEAWRHPGPKPPYLRSGSDGPKGTVRPRRALRRARRCHQPQRRPVVTCPTLAANCRALTAPTPRWTLVRVPR
jgi:hypothetical protein